ncbi:MAG: hypothetical protein ABIU05_15590 [Nitrospirales bacterium]
MNVSAPIAKMEVEIQFGTPSSRHDHVKGARPRKRGDDEPGRGLDGRRPAEGLAVRSVNILFQVCLPPVAGSALKPVSPTPPRGLAPLENPHEGGTPPSELPDGEDPASRLRAPVSHGYGTISRRTVMKNVG